MVRNLIQGGNKQQSNISYATTLNQTCNYLFSLRKMRIRAGKGPKSYENLAGVADLVAELALSAGGLLRRLSLPLVHVLDVVKHPGRYIFHFRAARSLSMQYFKTMISCRCFKFYSNLILLAF